MFRFKLKRTDESTLKKGVICILLAPALIVALLLWGFPDKDVSAFPEYGFSSFAGTVWKTKVKLAVVTSPADGGGIGTLLVQNAPGQPRLWAGDPEFLEK
jgi:hypothetical protein